MKDRGVQRERTGLAWSRTSFLTVFVALLLLRLGIRRMSTADILAGLVLSLLAAFMFSCSNHRLGWYKDNELSTATDRTRQLTIACGVALAATLHVLDVCRHSL
ncbi:DUF202 domain-containing protein [Acetobacter sp. TBRC 12305]|uniref:DUF202 domain-containing protein n=1 Tax=Acetobacter garciniae TaxID=2817435 RepID=A0A939KPV4_9PROT|nr:DUF202 domain-containing protein [Acetobacter garciniae]MBO1324489.1 DUF202 domain-containing protein [Acetobacter garciniae]MBX0344178.1 DUF202 domain-containing protein [Acetobacter garciniae]